MRTPPTISSALASKPKPMIRAVAMITASWSRFVATSASVRPASTALRDIGSERKRSISPFLRSSERPIAVTKPPKNIVCTIRPGIRKST